jgi:hypothetical protein
MDPVARTQLWLATLGAATALAAAVIPAAIQLLADSPAPAPAPTPALVLPAAPAPPSATAPVKPRGHGQGAGRNQRGG